MILTQNLSQEQQTPISNVPVLNVGIDQPGSIIVAHNKNSSIGSSIITHSMNESLRFNKDESDNLKDIFSCFDKENTGSIKEEDLVRILEMMNKYSQNVINRISEIKNSDQIAKEQNRFTFPQFLKILGKVEVEFNEIASMRSNHIEEKQENKVRNAKQKLGVKRIKAAKELQQSCNIDDANQMIQHQENNYSQPRNKTVGARTKIENLRNKDSQSKGKNNLLEIRESNDKKTPRLQKNILVRRQGKQTSMEKSLKTGISPEKDNRKIKDEPISSHRMSKVTLPIVTVDAPMNLMQFRGVRIQPDK